MFKLIIQKVEVLGGNDYTWNTFGAKCRNFFKLLSGANRWKKFLTCPLLPLNRQIFDKIWTLIDWYICGKQTSEVFWKMKSLKSLDFFHSDCRKSSKIERVMDVVTHVDDRENERFSYFFAQKPVIYIKLLLFVVNYCFWGKK